MKSTKNQFCPLTPNSRSYITQFTQPDSIIPNIYNPLDLNRYSYVRNNPVNFNDPSGHYACEDSFYGCRQGADISKINGSNSYWKWAIKSIAGITMNDSNNRTWSNDNLRTAFTALDMINDKLNGKLTTMVGGTTFTMAEKIINPKDEWCKDPNHCIYSGNAGSTGVTYYIRYTYSDIPIINFLHETGHLLDQVPSTRDVFSGPLSVNTPPTWIDKAGYVNDELLIDTFGQPVQALPMGESNMPGEWWADAFANWVAGNINLAKSVGRDMANYVSGALAPYINPHVFGDN